MQKYLSIEINKTTEPCYSPCTHAAHISNLTRPWRFPLFSAILRPSRLRCLKFVSIVCGLNKRLGINYSLLYSL
ncbi:hypothetical protein XENTR_v10000331 [Xenopus tropicalis]|nr:hypothetical protein XENTR_v10000331 [Xenopus tropicalis]